MSSITYTDFTIRIFNVKGLIKKEEQELLAGVFNRYNTDVYCHQETKWLDINIRIRQHKLITLVIENIKIVLTTVLIFIAILLTPAFFR